MNEKLNIRFINRLLYFGVSLLIGALVVYVSSAIGALSFLFSVLGALLPVVIAIGAAYMLEPLVLRLIKWRIKRGFAVIIVYSSLALALTLVLSFLIPLLIAQLSDFIAVLPTLIRQLEIVIKDNLGISVDLKAFFKTFIQGFSGQAVSLLTSIINVFYMIAIALTGAIFLSLDFPYFRKTVKKLIPRSQKEVVLPFFHDFLPVIHKYISVLLLNASLLFVYATIILYFCQIPYPAMFGLIIALAKLIPVIGAYLGAFPLVLAGLAVSLEQGLINILVVTVIQFVESNIIAPIIVRGQMKIKPIENLIAVAILGRLFGFIGMIIAPIVVSGIKIASYQKQLRREKKDPTLVDPGAIDQIEERKKTRLADIDK